MNIVNLKSPKINQLNKRFPNYIDINKLGIFNLSAILLVVLTRSPNAFRRLEAYNARKHEVHFGRYKLHSISFFFRSLHNENRMKYT